MEDGAPSAIEAAFGLAKMPTLAVWLREWPLPSGIPFVLSVAAGLEPATQEVCARFSCSDSAARAIARLYLQQVMLFPGADSYRVLGVRSDASWEEIRRNRTLLIRWLHPDANRNDWENLFFLRVTAAWEELRHAHMPAMAPSPRQLGRKRESLPWRQRWIGHPVVERRAPKTNFLQRSHILISIIIIIFCCSAWTLYNKEIRGLFYFLVDYLF